MDNWAEQAAAQAVATGTGDEKTVCQFYFDYVLDEDLTKENGKPEYRKLEFARIITPGSGSPQTFLANDQLKRRFPKAYQWFQEQSSDVRDGTPIDRWNLIDAKKAKELLWYGIRTVEMLAEFEDEAFPSKRREDIALIGLARDYLSGQDEKDKEIEDLRQKLEDAAKPKRGRPPKIQDDDPPKIQGDDEFIAA